MLLKLCPSLSWKSNGRKFFLYVPSFLLLFSQTFFSEHWVTFLSVFSACHFSFLKLLYFTTWITAFNSEMAFHLFGGHTDGVLMMSTVYLIPEPVNMLLYLAKGTFHMWWSSIFCVGDFPRFSGWTRINVEDGERRVSVRIMSVWEGLDLTGHCWLWSWNGARRQRMWAISANWKRHEKFSRASGKEHSLANTLI